MARFVGPNQVPPLHRPFDPDDVIEFHAARLLVLLVTCGRPSPRPAIDGRTKIAKLDFFIRYPRFLEQAQEVLASRNQPHSSFKSQGVEVEASMIRYRYGPWDPRYPSILDYLETRRLIAVREVRAQRFELTAVGFELAQRITEHAAFRPIRDRALAMVGNLANWTGTELKDFVYDIFASEISALRLREVIRS
jgi:hypothetical protein